MSELREARERAGLSVEEASKRTRIPQRYLEALESGDHSVFGPGPFLTGYTRQYRAFLQLPDRPPAPAPLPAAREPSRWKAPWGGEPAARTNPEAPREPEDERTVPAPARPGRSAPRRAAVDDRTAPSVPSRSTRTRVLRMAAAGALACIAVALAVNIAHKALPEAEPTVGEEPDQKVTLAVVEPVRARVEADGKSLLDGSLLPGPARTFGAHDRLTVEVETLEGLTISYNGRTLTPLGARSHARRLVFVDDLAE